MKKCVHLLWWKVSNAMYQIWLSHSAHTLLNYTPSANQTKVQLRQLHGFFLRILENVGLNSIRPLPSIVRTHPNEKIKNRGKFLNPLPTQNTESVIEIPYKSYRYNRKNDIVFFHTFGQHQFLSVAQEQIAPNCSKIQTAPNFCSQIRKFEESHSIFFNLEM